mmetsp:Transcript_24474/g.55866  ORF Transcript_24474/g.55866 Transcript_24474/m.55866 type:complete len:243 (-) Transcript_24474:592-1320(-)
MQLDVHNAVGHPLNLPLHPYVPVLDTPDLHHHTCRPLVGRLSFLHSSLDDGPVKQIADLEGGVAEFVDLWLPDLVRKMNLLVVRTKAKSFEELEGPRAAAQDHIVNTSSNTIIHHQIHQCLCETLPLEGRGNQQNLPKITLLKKPIHHHSSQGPAAPQTLSLVLVQQPPDLRGLDIRQLPVHQHRAVVDGQPRPRGVDGDRGAGVVRAPPGGSGPVGTLEGHGGPSDARAEGEGARGPADAG